ncbi:MAG: multiheme c-type cytochrome [Candidatus Wallbacteria bacterium]
MPFKKTMFLIFLLLVLITAVHLFIHKKTAAINFYAGSNECGRCHNQIYSEWKLTAHANSLISITNETLLLPSEINELDQKLAGISFGIADIKYAIGYHWTRRYVLNGNNISPFLYSLQTREFINYYDKNYKHTNFETECIGCHVTGLAADYSNGTLEIKFAEAAVGCEACHGPGSLHSQYATKDFIINPAQLDTTEALMICAACHTNGNSANGKVKFALNYIPGESLMPYYKNMVPKPGQMSCGKKEFEYKGDNTIDDRLRQLRYWQYIFMQKTGSSCSDCLDFRNAASANDMRKNFRTPKSAEKFTSDEYCMSCHKFIGVFSTAGLKTINGKKVSHQNIDYYINLTDSNNSYEISINGPEKCFKCHQANSVHSHMFEISETSELIVR